MMEELKRRDLSGIYVFDKFPTDDMRKPTCIEDCSKAKRLEWCWSKEPDALRDVIRKEAETFREMCDFLVDEKCVTDEQRTMFFAMIDRAVERSKANWSVHELADQVDFICGKVVLLADACGVTKHKE